MARLGHGKLKLVMKSQMSRFHRVVSTGTSRETDFEFDMIGNVEPGYFLRPDDRNVNSAETFMIALREVETSERLKDTFCAFASILSLLSRDFDPVLKDALISIGVSTTDIKIPSMRAASLIEPYEDEIFNFPEIVVCYACSILILFKNINAASYQSYMSNRIKELRAKVGVELPKELLIPFSIEKAGAIRTSLGSYLPLKKKVLQFVMAGTKINGRIGDMCEYLSNILAFSEMHIFTFIYDTLCLTKSPVLSDHRVYHEVRNLCFAFEAINASDYPQFFRYFAHRSQLHLIERSKFPILASVAQGIKKQSNVTNTVDNFQLPVDSTENKLVTDLIEVHRAHMAEGKGQKNKLMSDYLTTDVKQMSKRLHMWRKKS